jgi:hypothetical protein
VPSVALHSAIVLLTAEIPFAKLEEQFYWWTPYVVTPAAGLLIVLPSTLALARVRASLLPAHEDSVVAITRVDRGVGFWRAVCELPVNRLLWFLAKGLPVWGVVNGAVLGPVAWGYWHVYGSDA